MRFYDAAPVTGKLSTAMRSFKRRNVILFWATCPLWLPTFLVVGYLALGLTRVGFYAECFLGWMGIDAWE